MLKKNAARAKTPWQIKAFIVAAVLIIVIGVVWLVSSMRSSVTRPVLLPAMGNQQVSAYGNEVLYYDGAILYCLTGSGDRRWFFQVGQYAGYHSNGKYVTAWTADQLYILDQNGKVVFNDRMSGIVQFARIGNSKVAAFVGDANEGFIHIFDLEGRVADPQPIKISYTTILDIGFFSSAPEMMWVLGLDTSGTVLTTVMQTYDPGKFSTGNSTLGEQLVYRVYYHNSLLRVVDTRQIRSFDYRIKENTANPPILIYGWYLQDIRQIGRDLVQLLVPVPQMDGSLQATDLRLITGDNSRVLHLPSPCVSALLGEKAVYAFSENALYMCRYGETSFTAYPLTIQVKRVIGITGNDRAIIADLSDATYLLPLPK